MVFPVGKHRGDPGITYRLSNLLFMVHEEAFGRKHERIRWAAPKRAEDRIYLVSVAGLHRFKFHTQRPRGLSRFVKRVRPYGIRGVPEVDDASRPRHELVEQF